MTAMRRIHTHSVRLANGEEALVTRVLAGDGKVGYGFSLRLDATESRHMAESDAGRTKKRALPRGIQAAIDSIHWEDE